MATRIGIDFGTANTVVARWDADNGRGEPIPLDGVDLAREAGQGVHQRVVPSLIAYSHGDDRRWLGAQVHRNPELRDGDGVSVFRSTKANVTGRVIDIGRPVGERKITARDAATQFLSDLTALALLTVDTDDLEIVATAPVETFDSYRDWLVQEVGADFPAARLRVVDEATAAAVGYAARMNPGDVFCVFDFGAGTLDVSVVRVQEPETAVTGPGVRTIAKTGLDLGGNHIDAMLAAYAAEKTGLPDGDQIAYNKAFDQLLSAAEDAKIVLAAQDSAVVGADHPTNGRRYETEVTRADFDRLLAEKEVLRRVNRALRRTLDSAAARGYTAEDIGNVFLVGGSSLIPAVQEQLRMQFDTDVLHLDRPLEAVAAGAAGIAGGFELHDHIQHDYAIRHVNPRTGEYEFETLVEAGTAYPTPESIKSLTIKAIHDGQRHLGLAIYELAHATYRDSSADMELMFPASGGAHVVAVSAQKRQERSMLWLNEDSPTFLEADPPAKAGSDRFRLDFRIDEQKRLTVSAFDIERRIWALDAQPVIRLS